MASLYQQRAFHVTILLFIATFVIDSSLGTSLVSKSKERKEPAVIYETYKTTTPAPAYPMTNSKVLERFTTVAAIESSTTSPFNSFSISQNSSDNANSVLPNTTLSAPSSLISDAGAALDSEVPIEAGDNEKRSWKTEDLLVPVPRSVSLLTQLITLSMTQLDTALRGSSQRNQTTSIQYQQSFRTTLLQISQKLSNTFSLINTNSDKIESLLLDAPEKFQVAFNYLKKFQNSSRNANFLMLPLNSLKEATDQTFDLSTQIVDQLSGSAQLTEDLVKTLNSSKTEKKEEMGVVIVELQSTQAEKTKIENELINIEKDIKNLKDKKRLNEAAVVNAIEDLEQLKTEEKDRSRCYQLWDQKEGRAIYKCPYLPDPSKIRQAEIAKEAPQKLFESTIKQLDEKERIAQRRREKDNKLLITMQKLFFEKNQLAEDIALLEKSSAVVIHLLTNFRLLENSWIKFVGFCEGIQEGVTKSHASVNETIENPSSWNGTLSDVLTGQLKDTQENISLLMTIVHFYLEGSRQYIMEIIVEVEQMMTKRGNPKELQRRLLAKSDAASRGMENFFQNNSQLREVDFLITQKISKLQ